MSDPAIHDEPFNIDDFLAHLSQGPGVYRMLDREGTILYVGKARNLKRRVSSYFRGQQKAPKTARLVAQIARVEVTLTRTEGEALILENNLIKQYRPRYNILLRDDKSYPYIFLSADTFPRLGIHRGSKRAKGRYFGPFPSSTAVRESLNMLQKLFPVRQCEDSFFRNRSRPCLQYQIKRCTGPCVGLVDEKTYQEDVRHSVMFLEGKSSDVIDELVRCMDEASTNLEFEEAARLRDQIANLRRVQERQFVSGDSGDLDIIGIAQEAGLSCVQVLFVRDGRILGHRTYFPQNSDEAGLAEVLGAFMARYYLTEQGSQRFVPTEILVTQKPADGELLEEALSEQSGRKVRINERLRGERARWQEMSRRNVQAALKSRLATQSSLNKRFEALTSALELESMPERIECFDISHTQGEETVASCVVFDRNGPRKSDYRRYNIEGITPGDDYAAMEQALMRRYQRLKEEGLIPDLLLIDGGKGQLSQAAGVLDELQLGDVALVGVAKGPTRKPGLEQLWRWWHNGPLELPADNPGLHLIQQIRDEAHRFAITGHRQRRAKKRSRSPLEDIAGLGPKRRQLLLRQFGGLQELSRAGVEEICSVKGISKELAQRIVDAFHVNEG